MADIKEKFGAANTALVITLNNLASSAVAGRQSTYVDNSANLYLDALVRVIIKMPAAGAPANDKAVYVYAFGSADDGATYDDGAGAADAAFTHTDPPNLSLLGIINCPANTLSYKSRLLSVSAAFGGALPSRWGIIVRNYTGLALDAAGNSAHYQGLLAQTV